VCLSDQPNGSLDRRDSKSSHQNQIPHKLFELPPHLLRIENTETPKSLIFWCARTDSNRRPPGSKEEGNLGAFSVVSPLQSKFFRTCTYTALTGKSALQHENGNLLILLVVREGLEPSTSAL
jgi:hypothetical protein